MSRPAVPLLALAALALITLAGTVAGGDDMIHGREHFLEANGVRLRIWEKFAGTGDGKPIVVLAHGSATAGEESFDLQVPGRPSEGAAPYSLMDFLAGEGFDVFAPDIRGFGRSTHPDAGVTTEEAQTDLDAVIDHVLTIRDAGQVHLVAWSWGTQFAGLETIAHPQKIARYVSFAQMHKDSPDVVKRRERLEEFRKSTYMEIPEAGWKKRFTSMTPERVNDAAAIDAYARAAGEIEKKTPTGPQIDMTTRLPLVDPMKISVPVLIIHGEFDDVADTAGLLPFFAGLQSPQKSYVIIPDAGHMAQFQAGRGRLQHAIAAFLKP